MAMRTALSSIRSAIGVCGFVLVYQRALPQPDVNLDAVVEAENDRNPPNDPKCQLKFGNAGWGAMFIHNVRLVDASGNRKTSRLDLLWDRKYRETKDTTKEFYRKYTPARVLAEHEYVPVATWIPLDAYRHSQAWFEQLQNDIQSERLYIEVEFSAGSAWPLCMIRHHRRIPIGFRES